MSNNSIFVITVPGLDLSVDWVGAVCYCRCFKNTVAATLLSPSTS